MRNGRLISEESKVAIGAVNISRIVKLQVILKGIYILHYIERRIRYSINKTFINVGLT